MIRALRTAATGMEAQQKRIDVTAHNIANVNTSGFRRMRAEFQDLLYQTERMPGATTGDGSNLPTGIQVGHGVRLVSTTLELTQGTLQQTGNPLDLAIEGRGFFQVTQPNGELAYTRAGNLKVDAEGRLVTVDGYLLEPAVTIPQDATSVTVTPDGVVSVTTAGQSTAQEVGRIELAGFPNPSGLQAMGRSLYLPTSASGEPIVATPGTEGLGTVAQGFLEGSNVQVVTEMIDLIASQRAYEVSQRVVQAADEMLQRTTQR